MLAISASDRALLSDLAFCFFVFSSTAGGTTDSFAYLIVNTRWDIFRPVFRGDQLTKISECSLTWVTDGEIT